VTALACTQTLAQCFTIGALWLSGAWQLHDTALAFAWLCFITWVNCGLFQSHLLNLLKTVPKTGPATFIHLQLIKNLQHTLFLRKVLGLFGMSVFSVTEKVEGLFKQLWLKKSQFVVTLAWQKHVK